VEYGFSSPTATNGLSSGSGAKDYLVNSIYSKDIAGHTIDLNVNLTSLGNVQTGEAKQQWGWAATMSRPINGDWGVAAELSGSARQGVAPSDQFLVAVSYQMNRRVVWDAGFSAGLNNAAPKQAIFVGVSVLAGKMF